MTICMYVCTALVAHEVEGSTEDSCTKCPLYTECIHPLNLLLAPYIEEVFIGIGWSGVLAWVTGSLFSVDMLHLSS